MTDSSSSSPPDLAALRASFYQERMHQHAARYPEFHAPSVDVIIRLVETYHLVSTTLSRALTSPGISPSAVNLLTILRRSEGGGRPLGELSGLMLVTPASITGLVDSLVRRGLVERATDERDRRVRIARITAAGEQLLHQILPPHYLRIHDLLSGLEDDEMKALGALLDKLGQSVREHNDLVPGPPG